MKENKKRDLVKKPPSEAIESVQYSLFQSFLTNNISEVSNAIEVWESIPKYFLTPPLMERLRTSTGHADPYLWEYQYQNKCYKVKIQPALIEQEDGSYKA